MLSLLACMLHFVYKRQQLADSLQSVVPGMSLVSSFLDYVAIAAYFVPIDTIVILFSCIVLRELFKIGLAFMKMLFNFIPFM